MFQVYVVAHANLIFSTALLHWALRSIPVLLSVIAISIANPSALSNPDHCTCCSFLGKQSSSHLPGTCVHVPCFQFHDPLLPWSPLPDPSLHCNDPHFLLYTWKLWRTPTALERLHVFRLPEEKDGLTLCSAFSEVLGDIGVCAFSGGGRNFMDWSFSSWDTSGNILLVRTASFSAPPWACHSLLKAIFVIDVNNRFIFPSHWTRLCVQYTSSTRSHILSWVTKLGFS